MTSRVLALCRGKTGDVQNFSYSRPLDPVKDLLLRGTLGKSMNTHRRTQILNDPMNCYQFLCRWGDTVGFFTRPSIESTDAGATVVVGSFTDTIGQVFPFSVPLDDFQGYFTTLVPRQLAEQYGLPMYPTAPDTVPGPPATRNRNAEIVAPSMERLHFTMPEEPVAGDHPVAVALPLFLPVGPGHTCHHPLPFTCETDFSVTFPLLHLWRNGLKYCLEYNQGLSVTVGGPLFHIPG
jgi:hypothetical protein